MKYLKLLMLLCFTAFLGKAETEPVLEKESTTEIVENDKQMKMEATLTSKKWICLNVSKRKMTKKLSFDIGNEINFSIDKKYSFKNNNYDYSNGTWKIDGKFLYFFYNAKGTENRMETIKYKVLKLTDNELLLKRMDKPKGKLTFK